MIEIGGRPLLEYNVRALTAIGVSDIVINTHYHPDVIQRHFGTGERFGARISYSHEPVLLGTAGALLPVKTWLDETFVLLFGDNLTDCDLHRVVKRHNATSALATLAVFERDDVLASGIVGVDSNGIITRFLEKPQPHEVFSHWVNAGIIVAEPDLIAAIPRSFPSDLGRDVLPGLLDHGAALAAYMMHEHLWWIDSPADYERTRNDPEFAAFITASRARDRAERFDAT